MKLRSALGNAGVMAVSAAVALLLCEGGARLMLTPADYLQVQMVADPILGAVPSSGSRARGFDAWGFRNLAVPPRADVVTIGDSHTYGNTATLEDSWPSVVKRSTSREVYNLALGGYGPNQYFHLFEAKALALKPGVILCGLYMGDDFENAYLITYGLDHWASLRALAPEEVSYDIWETPAAPGWHKPLRLWLSRNSLVYQLLFHGPLLGRFQGELQIRRAHDLYEGATSLILPDKHIEEAFLPRGILKRLDQRSKSVLEGMRITFGLLMQMSDISRQRGISFLVVVIPTKEMVFAEFLERNRSLPLSDVLDALVANERMARDKTFQFLRDAGIAYVDVLPELRASVGHELYARTATDMHPGKNGYRVIGEAVANELRKRRLLARYQ